MSVSAVPTRLSPLRAPGVARLLALSMVARTPEAALGLLLILRVRDLGGSFALAGAVSGILALGLAAGGPLLGRLIDRHGQTATLTVTGLVAAATVVVAGLLPDGASPALLAPLALVAGVAQPPVAPCLRALFGRILTDPHARHGALAMDAALQEISFIAGPLVFVSALAAISPGLALLAAGVALAAGTLAFAAAPESRAVPGSDDRRPRAGALAAPGVRTLLLVAAGMGTMFGAVEVAVAGAADAAGSPAALGILLAVWGVPSLISGLLTARLGAPRDQGRALVLLVAGAALPTAALALMPDLWTLGLLLAASGLLAAPMFATLYSLVSTVAIRGTVTEAFTWVASGLFAGLALGGAMGGAIVSASGAPAAFAAAGAAALVAALLAAARVWTLRPEAAYASPSSPGPSGTRIAPSTTGSIAASSSSANPVSVASPQGSSTRSAAAACTAAAIPSGPS